MKIAWNDDPSDIQHSADMVVSIKDKDHIVVHKSRNGSSGTYVNQLAVEALQPIPMRLPCPGTVTDPNGRIRICGALHVDEGEFATTKIHHTHACQICGHVWRPAVVNTVGVRFLPGYKIPSTNTESDQ